MLIAHVDIGLDGAIEDKHGPVLRLVDDMPGKKVGKEAGRVSKRGSDSGRQMGQQQDQKQC